MQPAFHLGMWAVRKLYQSCVVNCTSEASQDVFNAAWTGFDFALDYRSVTFVLMTAVHVLHCSALTWGLRPQIKTGCNAWHACACRVSDAMVFITMVLMFGSGMPILVRTAAGCRGWDLRT